MNKAKLIASIDKNCPANNPEELKYKDTILAHIEAFESEEEKFYCAEWNRTGSICEEQCSGCKRSDELVINSTPTVPTFTAEEINEALEKARLQWWATPNRGLREVQTSAILNLINTKLGGQGK